MPPNKSASKPGAALHEYLHTQLSRIDEQLDPALSADPQAIHGARQALRRFRSAARVYKDLLPKLPRKDRESLKELARRLGESRDAHVLAMSLERAMDEGAEWRRPAAIQGLIRALDVHSSAQAGHAAQAGQAPTEPATAGYRCSIHNLKQALDRHPGIKTGRKKARTALQASWLAVRSGFELTMAEAGAEEHHAALHNTRKALKELRYATEAVAPAFPETAAAIVEPATIQQRFLGEQHDAVLARSWLATAAERHALDPADAAALAAVHKAKAEQAEVSFYRTAGQTPVPAPEAVLRK